MRIISPQFLSSIYIVVAAAIVLPLPTDVAGVARSSNGDSPPATPYRPPLLHRKGFMAIRSPRELAQRTTTSAGSTMSSASGGTGFTSTYQVLQSADLPTAPDAQDADRDLWLPRFGVLMSSASVPGSITRNTTLNLHNVRDALELDAILATPSLTSTISASTTTPASPIAFSDLFTTVVYIGILVFVAFACASFISGIASMRYQNNNSYPRVPTRTANNDTTQAPANSSTESTSTLVGSVADANRPPGLIAGGVDASVPSVGTTVVAGVDGSSPAVEEASVATDARGPAAEETSVATDARGPTVEETSVATDARGPTVEDTFAATNARCPAVEETFVATDARGHAASSTTS